MILDLAYYLGLVSYCLLTVCVCVLIFFSLFVGLLILIS